MTAPADALRAFVGRRLERGLPASRLARFASSAWGVWSGRSVARPLRLPAGVRVIGVGGAVLGGAGKTPVAIALARALADRGEGPALVGHAYRASPGRARVVLPGDAVTVVGDDALAAARALAGVARVVVAPTRQAAVDLAAGLGHRVIIVDGLLQAAPDRLASAVLVLDALAPWGSGACPPAGDLRAPCEALLAAANLVGAVLQGGAAADPSLPAGVVPIPSRIGGAVAASGERIPLAALAGLRLGLLVAVARPERIVSALAREGIRPRMTVFLADHAGALSPGGGAGVEVEAWLTTARCATKLPEAIDGAPVLALDHRVDVTGLVGHLATRAGG